MDARKNARKKRLAERLEARLERLAHVDKADSEVSVMLLSMPAEKSMDIVDMIADHCDTHDRTDAEYGKLVREEMVRRTERALEEAQKGIEGK